MTPSRVKNIQEIIFSVVFYFIFGVILLGVNSSPLLYAQNLQEHLPKEIAGLERNNEVTINKFQTTATATYNSDDHPNLVTIQLSKGDFVQKADSMLSKEFSKPSSNLEQHTYNGSKIYFRTQKSSVTHLSYTKNHFLAIEALAAQDNPINSDHAKVHLSRFYDEMIRILK